MTGDNQKQAAARRALDFVEDGMKLGIGTGSTAEEFVKLLAERVGGGARGDRRADIGAHGGAGEKARRAAFTSTHADLTIDGADELDSQLRLIKGGGGALLREKIVAMASNRVCIIGDASKRVERLGAFPLPVEITDFGLAATLAMIEASAAEAECRGTIAIRRGGGGELFRTDGGHLIVDCAFGSIPNVELLADLLDIIPGVMEHGLFIDIADEAVLAGPSGVTVLRAYEEDL